VQGLDLWVEARPNAVGDSIHQLVPGSAFAATLDRLDPDQTRLVFAVDTLSVDVFRKARQMAAERGLAVDWRPVSLDFPLTHRLAARNADEALLASRDGSKPIR
jgi:hypothetical protein